MNLNIKLPKIAQEGFNLIAIFAVVTIVLMFISVYLGFIGIVLTVWCVTFFRDPQRVTPQTDNLIIAPADGRIIIVDKVTPPEELGFTEKMLKISIFMNVFNVHVNRAPTSGVVEKILYIPGKFINASFDKASIHNERQSFIMNTTNGKKIAFVQIAGLVARRIVKFIEEGKSVKPGEKVGLIKFGSRVDVYLPANIVPLVSVGQTTIAGETILADLNLDNAQVITYEVMDKD
jgi:phosphatidylserine decarboxylase